MLKEKLKIYLQRPIGINDSAYYKYLKDFPPKGIDILNINNSKLLIKKGVFKKTFLLKMILKKIIIFLKISLPNAYLTKNLENYDIIHCAHCLSKNDFPWVADFEHVKQFWFASNSNKFNKVAKKKVIKYLGNPNCKKIMPWSEWTKREIEKEFPELKNKLEVLYPAIKSQDFTKINNGNVIKILFVGRDFKMKGGEIAIKTMDKIIRKYPNVKFTVVSEVPEKIVKKYENKNIEFMGLVSHDKLFNDIYPSTDIFLYPTFSDTMGFSILEAQAFGIPVVVMKTISTHTIEETINNGKTGIIIENIHKLGLFYDNNIIDKFYFEICKLIENPLLIKKMGKAAKEQIDNGKFSIKTRDEKLNNIYREVLKKN